MRVLSVIAELGLEENEDGDWNRKEFKDEGGVKGKLKIMFFDEDKDESEDNDECKQDVKLFCFKWYKQDEEFNIEN